MPKVRFPLNDLQGFDPAIEPRTAGSKSQIIAGKNFFWDSKGPKSGFGTRLLGGGQVIEEPDGIAQSIEINGQSFVFTSRKIWMLSADGTQFTQIYDLQDAYGATINPWMRKWTAAYLSRGIYFAHYNYGLFKLGTSGYNYTMTPKDQDDIPGIPYRPIAVAEVSGRLVILGSKYLGWSSQSDAENWTPALGGAGQQLLSDRVSGRPITLIAFQGGAFVWTEEDCLTAEFIGGDLVFRYDRMKTKQIPLGSWCVEELPDGSQLIFSKQGLHRTANGSQPEALTPVFNEFIRERLKHRHFLQIRLTYVIDQDLLYVQCRDHTNHYVETFVLSINLDRWGVFNDRHVGIIRYRNRRGAFGYVDDNGVAHKFVDNFRRRERTPGVYDGLDSFLEVGYFKPPEMHGEVDSLLEMQELLIGGFPARPSTSVPNTVDLGDIDIVAGDCASYSMLLDFVTPLYRINGVPHHRVQISSDLPSANVIAGVGLQVLSSAVIVTIDVPGQTFDMHMWNPIQYCWPPSLVGGVAGTVTLENTLVGECLEFQAPAATDLDPCNRIFDMYGNYTVFTVTRRRVLVRWEKKDEFPDYDPIPVLEDKEPYIRAALLCGLTFIVEVNTTGGFGPLLTFDDGDGNLIRLLMTDTDSARLVMAASTVDMTVNSPVVVANGIYKIGITIGKENGSNVDYSLSVNGSVATTVTKTIDGILSFLQELNFFVGMNPDADTFLGANAWIRKVEVLNAVAPANLTLLTS